MFHQFSATVAVPKISSSTESLAVFGGFFSPHVAAFFRTCPHGIESRLSADFLSPRWQQLLVVEGSRVPRSPRDLLPVGLARCACQLIVAKYRHRYCDFVIPRLKNNNNTQQHTTHNNNPRLCPQERIQRHIVEQIIGTSLLFPILDDPVPLIVDQLVEILNIIHMSSTFVDTSCLSQACPFFCVTCGGMDLSGQPMVARASGAAQRRKLRRLRADLRHEQQSIAMALASALHHSADKTTTVQRPTGTEERWHRVLRAF